MTPDCAFTICAKNYLAQAITLRESFLLHNKGLDFHIFISDSIDGLSPSINIIPVDNQIVPNNTVLAFKYDVVEYSTAVKPFIISYLFDKGYEKISYIDPDIFVTDSLECIYDALDKKSAVLTPHRCTVLKDGELTPEISILYNGMFNLGFLAIKNNAVGQELIKWWSEKLYSLCYMDIREALAVDQKWMEFAMCFYPEQILVSHHLGMNVATWNLQERELEQRGNEYFIRSKKNPDVVFPLLFWHFSSFNPKVKQLLKNDPGTEFDKMPEIKELATIYANLVLGNKYEHFSKLRYAYNFYDNGMPILPIHRRLYRVNEERLKDKGNPFDSTGFYFTLLQRSGLLIDVPQSQEDPRGRVVNKSENKGVRDKASIVMRLLFKILGVQRYARVLRAFDYYSKLESNGFLLKW